MLETGEVREGRPLLLAVLIDADNVSASNAEAILREITSYGEPALRRVYGDWSNQQLKGWVEKAQELGLVQHQQTSNTRGKNSSDIGLVIDAMDILHSGRFDGFVLVSSDSDFTRLAIRIREQGLTVIGIGEEKTPRSLKNVCNRFVTIENILEKPGPAEDGRPQAPAGPKRPPSEAVPLIIDAMDRIDPEGEWYPLGQIGNQLLAEIPDFDPRSYGKTKLSDLVRETRRFELRRGPGNHLQIRRRD